jgi:uncharacterized protein involved in outer membrane biogenesis
MKRVWKWLAAVVLVLVLLLGTAAVALQQWVGSADFRGRVAQQISAALGIRVDVGGVSVDVWPLPAIALEQVQVKSQPPLTLERTEARPAWLALLQGRREIATLLVRNVVVPQQALAVIAAGFDKAQRAGKTGGGHADGAGSSAGLLPHRIVLDQVTWLYATGGSSTVDAQARLDLDGLPGTVNIQVAKGRFHGARAVLTRGDREWLLKAEIGGGTIKGPIRIQPAARGTSAVQAQLATSNVELSALTERSRLVTGRLDAQTTASGEVGGPGAILDALQSRTQFTVRNAVLHGIDLAQAAKSVGMNRSGETQMDTFAGVLVTHGRAVQLNNLVATSGLLSATGNVAMAANHDLSGRINVDLASRAAAGALSIPLAVGGTLESPSVMLTQGAMLGAAIGTLIAPGAGTGAGASVGDRLGEGLKGLFGK